MGQGISSDTIPLLVTLVDVHNVKAQDMYYFANISTGGSATKVISRGQMLSVEVGLHTVITMAIHESPQAHFDENTARYLGLVRFPVKRLAERYSSGLYNQWLNLDTTDPRTVVGDAITGKFEAAYADAVTDPYAPKVCVSLIGSTFEVKRSGRDACSIFVGEDVKREAGPDLKALIASHKQQAAYIDSLHEELRRLAVPTYRPMNSTAQH